MSLLNTYFMDYCLDKGNKESFSTDIQRQNFENEISENYEYLKFFVDEILLEEIRRFKKGETDDISLNEDFRHKDTIFNPESAMKRLKRNKFIKDNGYEHIIDKMYIDTEREDLQGISICSLKDERNTLTDINHGFNIYNPCESIIPSYNKNVVENEKSFAYEILSPYYKNERKNRFIPNPYLLPLLKGNMGEVLFQNIIDKKKIILDFQT